MVFLLGALCYTICTMKAPPQALERPGEEPSWHLPFPEGSSPGPSRAWGGGFKVFLLGALCYTICTVKAPPEALEGPGEEPSWHLPFRSIYRSLLSRPWRGDFMVFLFGALCYTICTMKAPHQAALSFCWEGPRCKTMCYAVLFF